ncbi:MAG: hypothetical protein HWD92_13000 [Flavobacteriia bacterium]|nr:hypothetical protein [Flavobacteriia bacterium]
MRYIAYIALFLLAACAPPLIVHVDDLPDNTPLNEPVYITGNFNHWQPGDPMYQINRDSEGGGYVEIPRGIGHLEFKFTRGSWSSEEVDSCGNVIPNRYFNDLSVQNIHVEIDQWIDMPEVFCDGLELLIYVPPKTPFPAEVYVTGDFNDWDPSRSQFRAQFVREGLYRIELPASYAGSAFKITRGTFTAVEVGSDGRDIENRFLTSNREQTVTVDLWKDICLQEHPYRYIVLTHIPNNTPESSQLYFASNTNGWNPSDEFSKFRLMPNGDYIIQIQNSPSDIEFKVTRGFGWQTVEVGPNGGEISNRRLKFGVQDTVRIEVDNWKDLSN